MSRSIRPTHLIKPSESPASPVVSSGQASTLESMLSELRVRRSGVGGMLGANFESALDAVWANRTRSLLTGLGIFIGVAAVIAALTLTQGAGAFITNLISGLGANTITISPGAASNRAGIARQSVQTLTPFDVQSLGKVSHVTGVSPVVSSNAQVVFSNQNWTTRIQGVSTDYQTIQDWQLAEGLWFSSIDDGAGKPVAVIGDTVAQNLFGSTGIDPVGQTVRIRNQLFRVVGVLVPKGGGFNQDDVVFVPFRVALSRLKNTTTVDQIQVQVDSTDNVDRVQQAVTNIIEQNHRIPRGSPDDFQTVSSTQLLQQATQATQAFTFLLVGIAAISLTVGGIGIMNIMLVSVTERTREIGIRMSIGARRRDIRNQFLIEALTLCLVGGVVGMLLGLLLGFAVTSATGLPFVVTATTIIMPFAVSAGIGVIFGLYPAVRASRLDPIVALRRAK